MFNKICKAALLLGLIAVNNNVQAVSIPPANVLTSYVNIDNMFIEYLSPSATSLVGATIVQEQIISQGSIIPGWGETYINTATISGSTQYLIIQAINVGGPGGFLGDFSLSGTSYQFSNGTQSLLTGDSAWSVSTNGINGVYTVATNEGVNGVSPWGTRSGVNSQAQWISDTGLGQFGNGGYGTEYFETQIISTSAVIASASAVPEPTSIALLTMSLLGFTASRRKNKQA